MTNAANKIENQPAQQGSTPGSWELGIYNNEHKKDHFHITAMKDISPDLNVKQKTIAHIFFDKEISKQEAKANARLVAAAPTMHHGIIIATSRLQDLMNKFVPEQKEWKDLQKILFGLFDSLPKAEGK